MAFIKEKKGSILIAGTNSSCGKTTIAIALMAFFTVIGKKVCPFKIGPDYIDPKFHFIATGNKSYNLDGWMHDELTIKYLYNKHVSGFDLGILEGVMGLYDGYNLTPAGSTAHLSKILNLPVILVVDSKEIGNSILAMISGYINYDPDVKIEGVILNNMFSSDYYYSIKEKIEEELKIKCLGYFPKIKDFKFESRHLGLIPVEEQSDINKKIRILSDNVSKTIDTDSILNIIEKYKKDVSYEDLSYIPNNKKMKLGIAKDNAFSFYYEDNLELMMDTGIELIYFSPLDDPKLPENIDGLYLGGGFPEVFAARLSLNTSLMEDIRNKLINGMPAYAECGGMMYLTQGIYDKDGNFHRMVGFFNCSARMTESLQRFGYTEIEYEDIKARAHEFHYSELIIPDDPDFEFKFKLKKISNGKIALCGIKKLNVLAGYPHVHFYSSMDFFGKIRTLYSNK